MLSDLSKLLSSTDLPLKTSIAAIFFFVIIFRSIIIYRGNYLRKFNGPLLAGFTDFYKYFMVISNRDRIITPKLHEKYGDVVRLGPKKLSFAKPQALKDIYGVGKGFYKSEFYSVAAAASKGQTVRSLFSLTNEQTHAKLRRSVNNAFALSTLVQYEQFVDSTIQVFMEQLSQRFADKSGPEGLVDWPIWLQYYAFDVIGELTYSERHGFLEGGKDIDGIIAYLTVLMNYLSSIGNAPILDKLFWKNPVVMWLSRQGFYDNSFPAVPFAKAHMETRFQALREGKPQRAQKDLLTKFMEAHKQRPEVVTEKEVLAMCLTMIFAGSETTAVSLSAIFYYLLQNPRCLEKLREEFETQLPPANSDAQYYSAPFAELQKLPYLDACVKEAFRMHPPPGFDQERVVPQGGATIAGEYVPEGTIVSCNAWVLHRDKAVFGDDIEAYRPERWLEDEERARIMNNSMFHFGAGAHTCVGTNIAILEMYKLIPTVLMTYDLKLDNSYAGADRWKLHSTMFVKPSHFRVSVTRREQKAE